ncbi:hypothetical protein MRX96_027262 [Rhipicephalus microplus]
MPAPSEAAPKMNRSYYRQRSRAPSDRRVYVANVPFDCKWTDIKDLFRDKVGDVSYVELFEDETGKFRGCGIVELKDKASVPKAIEVLHRYEMKGRFLVVKEDFDVERDRFGRPIPRGRSGGDRMMDDRGRDDRDGYGRGECLWPILITRTDKEGNSKGHGIVEFEHPIEAVQAISMLNGQKLYNRAMSVRMDKYNEDLDGGLPSKLPTGLQGIGKGLGAGGNPLQMTAAQMAQMNMTGPVGGMPMGGGVNPVAAANMGLGGLGGMGGMGLGAGGLGAAGTGGLAAAGLGGMGSAGGLGGLSDRSMLGSGNLMGGAMASPTGLMGGLSGGLGRRILGLGCWQRWRSRLRSPSWWGVMATEAPALQMPSWCKIFPWATAGRTCVIASGKLLLAASSPVRGPPLVFDAGSVRYTDMKGRGTAIVRFNSERDAQRAVDMMNGIRLENRQIDVRLY